MELEIRTHSRGPQGCLIICHVKQETNRSRGQGVLPEDEALILTYKGDQTSADREKGFASTGAADVQSSEHGEIWGPPEGARGEASRDIPGAPVGNTLQRLKIPCATTKTQCSQVNT